MCGIFGVRPSRRGASRSSACTRSSIADRSRSASSRSIDAASARARAQHGARCPTCAIGELDAAHGTLGGRPHALQHRRNVDDRECAAGPRSSRGGYIALAHNGNLINAGEMRVELEELGLDLRLDDAIPR